MLIIFALFLKDTYMRLRSVKDSIFSEYIIHNIKRPYGCYYLLENCVVSEISEGVIFSGLEALDIFTSLTEFYNGIKRPKEFIYISNRVNCYSVKPVDWLDFEFIKSHMIGYAIVDNRPRAHFNASFEQQFVPCESNLFSDLVPAVQWAMELHTRTNSN